MRVAVASKSWRWRVVLALGLLLVGEGRETALAGKITNEPQGFNDYTWGARSVDYPALKLLSDQTAAHPLPFVEVYEKPGEVLTLNGVTCTKVYYRFYKGQLGNIQFSYEGRENREKLLKWIEENYGKLPSAERKQKQIEWHGQNTVITLGYDVTNNQGRVWFTYLLFSPFDNATTDTTGY
jgi:hypothetical protein